MKPTIQGIVHVDFITNRAVVTDPFDFTNQGLRQVLSGTGGPFGEVEQQLDYLKTAKRIASAEPEWKQIWESNQLFLYLDITRQPTLASMTYTWHVTPNDDPATGVGLIPDGDTDWIHDYILAMSKTIVGRKRGKFGGIANPEGADDATDSEGLISEGREDMERLQEEILKRRRPLLPVIE